MAKAIDLIRGDDEDLELVVTDSTGAPVSIADSFVFITVKAKASDLDANAKLRHDVQIEDSPDAQQGKTVIRLPSAKTSQLVAGLAVMDVQVKFADGSVKTVYMNEANIIADITRRVVAE